MATDTIFARALRATVFLAWAASMPVHADGWRTGDDVPPGWVGVLSGGGMNVTRSAGVHVGGGAIIAPAHAFPGYEPGWHADVFQPRGIGNDVVKRVAVLRSLDPVHGIARLELADAATFSAAAPCSATPAPGERAGFYLVERERQKMIGVVFAQATFVTTRSSTAGTTGDDRYVFEVGVDAPLAAGAAFSIERGCYFGIATPGDDGIPRAGREVAAVQPPGHAEVLVVPQKGAR